MIFRLLFSIAVIFGALAGLAAIGPPDETAADRMARHPMDETRW